MKNKYELEETDIKNPTFHYFDDITRVINRVIDFRDILLDAKLYKANTKIFQFMIFHTKILWV